MRWLFNMKRPNSAFGNSNYKVASSQGNLNHFFISQEDMWIIREVKEEYLLIGYLLIK